MMSEPGGSCSPTAGPAGPAAPESRAGSKRQAGEQLSREDVAPDETGDIWANFARTIGGEAF